MIAPSTLERLARELAQMLQPLETRLLPDEIERTLLDLGLAAPAGLLEAQVLLAAFARAASAVAEIPGRVQAIDDASQSGDLGQILAAVTALIRSADGTVTALHDAGVEIQSLSTSLPGLSPGQRDELHAFGGGMASAVFHQLLVDDIEMGVPQLAPLLVGLACVEIVDEPGGGPSSLRVPYQRRTVRFDRLIQLVTDPTGLLRTAYGWGDASFDGLALFRNLKTLLGRYFGAPVDIQAPGGVPASLDAFAFRLQVNNDVAPPGLDAKIDVDLGQSITVDSLSIVFHVLTQLAAGTVATIRPFADVELHGGLPGDLVLDARVSRAATADPILLLGTAGGTRLEVREASAGVSLAAHWDAQASRAAIEPVVTGALRGARLVIEELGIDHEFDLAFRWTPRGGLEIEGGRIGPVTIERIVFDGASSSGSQLGITVFADATVALDPVLIRLEHFGLRFTFDLARGFGGLGVDWVLPRVQLRLTDGSDALPIEILGFFLAGNCLALRWRERAIGRWLGQLSSDLGDRSPAVELEMTLRVIFEDGAHEVRLDWAVGPSRTLGLPGFDVVTPEGAQVTLLLGGAGRSLTEVLLGLSFGPSAVLSARSSFAWERGDGDATEREIHEDASRASDRPLLQLDVTAAVHASLVLLDFRVDRGELPKFLRQLETPLAALDFGDREALQRPTAVVLQSLTAASWAAVLRVNPDALPFTLPFLQGGDGDEHQLIQVEPVAGSTLTADLTRGVIALPLGLRVAIGPMTLATTVDLEFRWETFAFAVHHRDGLKLYAATPEIAPDEDHLGLRWRFRGVRQPDGRHHYFTLATANHNYQLLQAPGAAFEVEYRQLSEEAIGFAIRDFRLTPKGVSLTATVLDRPAKLNGIDTRFRFQDTQLTIVENRITDFTLRGAGPLPPALVGDATADIALQLAQRDGRLTLVAGGAQLKGAKLLDCKATRFQFSIDALGVKFVDEGKFHLYFTLSGSARFKLAAGDDTQGALALLPSIRIDLVECPLAGDARTLARHVKFLIELPRPVVFSFLGAFEMELRGIGFVPQADVFGGDGAMLLTGQLRFAQGAGDVADSRTDLHQLYIGLPRPGGVFPRIHFANLPVHLNLGQVFQLSGVVDFVDGALEKGFGGEGVLTVQGLPTMAASFAFLRVRRDEASPWVRAWFIYVEVRKVSFQIPVVSVFLREVGLGFGYRFTLVSLRAADEANDARKLIGELTKLSRTQGDLSKRDRWALDLEPAGHDPRWTVALRALISQTSAQASPLRYDEAAERDLACLFLLDAVIALRSDLTFLMAVRGWIFTNYQDYVSDWNGIRNKPPLSGFVLLSPRQQRFLAHVASNPEGLLGPHPPLPGFVQRALSKSQFSATLLVEPGLLHAEMGWPNQLRWKDKLGPLEAEMQGGFLFRVSRDELVTGTSFLARARLAIAFQASVGIAGIKVSAEAAVAFGARYIGLVSLRDPLGSSALYGGIGIEAMIRFAIEFWIRIKLGFIKIQKTFRFSLSLELTAGLEIGFVGISADGVGLRGTGHLAVSVMGRRFSLSAHLGLNESAVQTALDRTRHVLAVGLEATDVEPIPGTTGTGSARLLARRAAAAATAAPALQVTGLGVPGYSMFVIRPAEAGPSYVVLFPAGERRDGGGEEPGFLPPPPADASVGDDFTLSFPDGIGAGVTLEQWVPVAGGGSWVRRSGPALSWRADWDAVIEDGGADADGHPVPPFSLRSWLDTAFVIDEAEDGTRSYRDPDPIGAAEPVADPRVHDPSDAAFEAAVRGAVEQFRGSPFFRRDPASAYEQLLERAYRDDTTVYHPSGELPADPAGRRAVEQQQQAHEARGLIVHDMIADLRDHVTAVRSGGAGTTARSVAFAMGLVFRVTGPAAWLTDPARRLTLRQRSAPDAAGPDPGVLAEVAAFNVPATDFAANPPRFDRIQQLSDARAIGLAWDLIWPTAPAGVSGAQADPEHHLMHYLVRRRALDTSDREVVFTVKGADTLHREPGDEAGTPGAVARLVRRFQIVDHFTDETAEDLAALPLGGKRYLYSITPVDFSGSAGRAVSLVATRVPSEPPLVPVDGECVVHYRVDAATLDPASAGSPAAPVLVEPAALTVSWTDPPTPAGAPSVPVATYQLVFRRDATLPIGSYGQDSTTQRPATKSLPTTNARALATDRKVVLAPEGGSGGRRAVVSPLALRQAGVLPAGGAYRPESWRVFFQTVSQSGVPSALAPVQLLLRVVAASPGTYDPLAAPPAAREERRPAELEWLPRPMAFAMLPPEDEAATVGLAHVPAPRGGDEPAAFAFGGDLGAVVGHTPDPGGRRCIRLRWNQGPSGDAEYPLALGAGYHLLQLDTDAHTTETFADAARLAAALRTLQEVQMIPADELALTPADTRVPAQWEAWYPSAVQRRRDPAARAPGSEIPRAPWYSWRESVLVWPAWPGLTDGPGLRDRAFHPALARLVALLGDPPAGAGLTAYRVEVQAGPPMQPGDLTAFLQSTAPSADPYGWGVLQRLGLSIAFRLRTDGPGEVVTGQGLTGALARVFAFAQASTGGAAVERELLAAGRHLHVELLFQPGRTIALEAGGADPDDLLALVQVSLRPAIAQTRRYVRVALEGRPGTVVPCVVVLPALAAASVIDQGDPAAGQAELVAGAEPTAFTRRVRLPLGGRTRLVVRAEGVPVIRIRLTGPARDGFDAAFAPTLRYVAPGGIPHVEVAPLRPPVGSDRRAEIAALLDPADRDLAEVLASLAVARVAVTDDASAAFAVAPEALAADLVAGGARASWDGFRRYVEALSSTDPDVPAERRLAVPISREAVTALVPDFAAWTQRFFDAAGPVAPGRDDPDLAASAEGGPWIATGYVRAGSPAHAAPDATGRLTYDQLVEDPWAHAYRFYVRPYGRYDRLWQSLRQSTVLFPGTRLLPDATPDPLAGGLDVVLDRTRPVAKPVVLSSTRLDAPSDPASPAPPGPTWEVILAEHPEQTLADHNTTLARQLAFRQLAFTIMRRFAYPDWIAQLAARIGADLGITPVADVDPGLPGDYPSVPEQLPPPPLAGADARALDLPLRMGPFQQGAIAFSWEGLPFFYAHHLLAVAQTATTVSPVNEVVQRDFAYVTPDPIAEVEPVEVDWRPDGDGAAGIPIRARCVRLALRKLGDSLPAAARARWPAEIPDGVHRTPGWLPDLGVVYQLVETFGGNVEVEAEVAWDEGAGDFARRQLGKRVRCDLGALTAPPAASAGDFSLAVVVQPIARRALSRAYDRAALGLPAVTAAKVAFEASVLVFTGVVTHADRAALAVALDPADRPAIDDLHDAEHTEEALSAPPVIPAGLADVLDLPPRTETRVVWDGAMSSAEKAQVLALPGDDEFTDALARLVAAVGGGDGTVSVTAPLGPEDVPPSLAGRVALVRDPDTGRYTELRWGHVSAAASGTLSDADAAALTGWPQVRSLLAATHAVVAAADAVRYTFPLPPAPPAMPWPEDLPASLVGRLVIDLARLTWLGPPPTAGERAALFALPADPAFASALAALVAAGGGAVAMAARRPRQRDLPGAIAGQLQLEHDRLTWTGRLHDAASREALAQVPGTPGDPDLVAAIAAVLAAIDAQVIAVPFTAPVRPAADALGALADKLVIGRARLRCHGLLTRAEAQALIAGLSRVSDRRAVARLYARALAGGLRGRALLVRTRRGSAPPASLAPIPSLPLAAS